MRPERGFLEYIFSKNGPTSASFSFIFLLSNTLHFLQQINVKKIISSIWCWDLNSRTLEHKLTTFRKTLMTKSVIFKFKEIVPNGQLNDFNGKVIYENSSKIRQSLAQRNKSFCSIVQSPFISFYLILLSIILITAGNDSFMCGLNWKIVINVVTKYLFEIINKLGDKFSFTYFIIFKHKNV